MKSVLVIDTPEDCKDCVCHLWLVCVPKDEDLEPDENGRYSIPSWCPLKPLPKKKNTDFHPNIVYANGWNDCLKEITNESTCD